MTKILQVVKRICWIRKYGSTGSKLFVISLIQDYIQFHEQQRKKNIKKNEGVREEKER